VYIFIPGSGKERAQVLSLNVGRLLSCIVPPRTLITHRERTKRERERERERVWRHVSVNWGKCKRDAEAARKMCGDILCSFFPWPVCMYRVKIQKKNSLQVNLLKPTGYVMHQQVNHSTTVRSAHTVFMCFVFIWEQTSTCATYSINWLVFIAEMKSVYSAVRTGSLNKARYRS